VAEGLLDVSPGKLGFDSTANARRAIYPVLFEGGLDMAGEATAARLAEVAGPTQHRAMLD